MFHPLPPTASCMQKNQFPAHFDFFAINFIVWSHILSTFGDALRALPYTKCLLSFSFHRHELRITGNKVKTKNQWRYLCWVKPLATGPHSDKAHGVRLYPIFRAGQIIAVQEKNILQFNKLYYAHEIHFYVV